MKKDGEEQVKGNEDRQREITQPIRLLTAAGSLSRPGYARRMHYIYNKDCIRANRFAVKEWDFYQISCGNGWILQMTIGHVSYMANFSAALFHIYTGERREFTRMSPLPMQEIPMSGNPELPHVVGVTGKGYRMSFQIGNTVRLLQLKAEDKAWGTIEIAVKLQNDIHNEKMVSATPFAKQNQFYLNYKENYYKASGRVRIGSLELSLTEEATALLDWGRGVWPFRQEWYWGNGTGYVEGKPFGFNIGWGFGNTKYANENFFFYDKKGYKLGRLAVEKDDRDWQKPWHFRSYNGSLDLTMEPVYDNHTRTKLAFVDNECHQVFGNFKGEFSLPNGERILVKNLTAFCEHAVNRW